MPHHEAAVAEMNGGYTRATSINLTIAHFVVTTDVTLADMVSLFSTTPANIVVVSYDAWMEELPSITSKLRKAVASLDTREQENRWDAFLMRHAAICTQTSRISTVVEKLTIGEGPHRFMCCECHIKGSRLSASGSVTLGVFSSAKDAGPYEEAWVKSVCHAVESNTVRYMCGVFWRGQEETATLFKRLRACEDGVFFQPFWTEESHDKFSVDQMAAIAARFGMVPDNVRYIAVYPAYWVVIGPSKDVSRPKMWTQPSCDGKLFFCGSGIERGLCDLSDVPQLPENTEVARDFLPLKQKPAAMWRWKKGVHQLVLWVGYSRPSKKSVKKRQAWLQRDRR